jgi:hypothetical protein
MAAVALPIALLLGLLADVVGGLVAWPLGGERRWWRRVTSVGSDLRRLFWTRDAGLRPAVLEAGGAVAALFGASLAAAAALQLMPDDLVVIYLALVLSAVGARIAASAPPTAAGEPIVGRARVEAALVEPAFALALGVMFLRYGTFDLGAARGTQTVLGPGLGLEPALVLAGLATAALVVTATGALRLPPLPVRGRQVGAPKAPGAAAALLIRLSRWALAGATAMVVSVLVAGRELEPLTSEAALIQGGAAVAVAVVLGALESVLRRLPDRWRTLVPIVGLGLAGGAVAMVVLG